MHGQFICGEYIDPNASVLVAWWWKKVKILFCLLLYLQINKKADLQLKMKSREGVRSLRRKKV